VSSSYFYSNGKITHGCTNRNYRNSSSCEFTLIPIGATWIKIVFDPDSFDIKSGDWIRIYDGYDANGTLLGEYYNGELPPDTIEGGSDIFVHFWSDAVATGAGFKLTYYSDGTLWPISSEDIEQDNISIYPNPNSGNFTLEMTRAGFRKAELEIYSTLGQKVSSRGIYPINGAISETIEMDGLPEGIYYLRLITNKNTYSKTIILE